MARCQLLLLVHLVLLLLAATNFTIVTAFFDGDWEWSAFQLSWQYGTGHSYEFPFSLPEVFAYMAAYSTGAVAFWMVLENGSPRIGLTGLLLCVLGGLSLACELLHWFFDFYESWIASAPIALLILAPLAILQEQRRRAVGAFPPRLGR